MTDGMGGLALDLQQQKRFHWLHPQNCVALQVQVYNPGVINICQFTLLTFLVFVVSGILCVFMGSSSPQSQNYLCKLDVTAQEYIDLNTFLLYSDPKFAMYLWIFTLL